MIRDFLANLAAGLIVGVIVVGAIVVIIQVLF